MRVNAKQLDKWIADIEQIDMDSLCYLVIKLSTLEKTAQGYNYIHKSIYEFYVQQSFMHEVS